jgi:dipeptidyl aminopeptidase/acylaminoacyl peptidase
MQYRFDILCALPFPDAAPPDEGRWPRWHEPCDHHPSMKHVTQYLPKRYRCTTPAREHGDGFDPIYMVPRRCIPFDGRGQFGRCKDGRIRDRLRQLRAAQRRCLHRRRRWPECQTLPRAPRSRCERQLFGRRQVDALLFASRGVVRHLSGPSRRLGLEALVSHRAYDDQAALSPDGRTLAFVSSRSGNADIWLLDMRTRKARNLTNAPGGDFRPSWSPDGKWIAFSSDRESLKPEASGTRLHHPPLHRNPHRAARRKRPSAGVGGRWFCRKSILVARRHAAGLLHRAGREVAKVTSPRRLRGTTQIETLDLATGQRTVLTSGDGEKWSPRWVDGQSIAYVSGVRTGGVERAAGSPGARGAFSNPAWSPDGRTMVFHRDVESAGRRTALDLARSALQDRSDRHLPILHARWRPPRQQRSDRRHPAQQHLDDGGGRHRRKMLFGEPERSALAPELSRDGTRVAFGLGQFFQNLNGPARADIATIDRSGPATSKC